MSGFDPGWLALREPADMAARNCDVLASCAQHFADRERISVVDLGCGTGSNLRALAPRLPVRQKWRLVDHDTDLLSAARAALAIWADEASSVNGGLLLRKQALRIEIEFACLDLARAPEQAVAGEIDLVTAAALFDLTSDQWIARLCHMLARYRLPLYAALTYNGVERWTPPHVHDAEMLASFHAHQAGDKGFGPAAGPQAAASLARILIDRGYAVQSGSSDWRLGTQDLPLIDALANGVARAVSETGSVAASAVAAWRDARRGASVRIGHADLFAAHSGVG